MSTAIAIRGDIKAVCAELHRLFKFVEAPDRATQEEREIWRALCLISKECSLAYPEELSESETIRALDVVAEESTFARVTNILRQFAKASGLSPEVRAKAQALLAGLAEASSGTCGERIAEWFTGRVIRIDGDSVHVALVDSEGRGSRETLKLSLFPVHELVEQWEFFYILKEVGESMASIIFSRDVQGAIPPGIRASREAFLRALPELLKTPGLRDKWIAFHGEEQIGIADDDEPLIEACLERGLKGDQYIVDVIEPKPAQPEKVELPSSWR
jgi:hypothetical protein